MITVAVQKQQQKHCACILIRAAAFSYLSCRHHAAQLLYGLIYVTGGDSLDEHVSSAECYDPDADQWMEIKSMNHERRDHRIAEVNGLIFAVGGNLEQCLCTGDTVIGDTVIANSVEFYDPAKDTWMCVRSTLKPKYFSEAASIGGCLYVLGTYLNSMERYEIGSCSDRTGGGRGGGRMSERDEIGSRRVEGREVVGGPWDGKGGESCGEGKSVEFGGRISHTQMWVYKSDLLCHHCPSNVWKVFSCVNEDVNCVNIHRLVVRKSVMTTRYCN